MIETDRAQRLRSKIKNAWDLCFIPTRILKLKTGLIPLAFSQTKAYGCE